MSRRAIPSPWDGENERPEDLEDLEDLGRLSLEGRGKIIRVRLVTFDQC